MITILDLKVVNIEHEVEQGEWLYRFDTSDKGCYVKRVKSESPRWGHGVLVQLLDKTEKRFMPANVSGFPFRFDQLHDAIDFVNTYKD